jgi:hypothetical protein
MKKLALPLSLLALGALGLNACGGGDDDEGTPAATAAPDTTAEARFPPETTTEAKLSREQAELKRAANDWASVFATNSCNSYMGEPLCTRLLPVSKAFQKSFADATVEDIALKGIAVIGKPVAAPVYRAAVKFSNGEVVVFSAGVKQLEWGIAPPTRRLYQAAAPLE